MKYHVTDTIGDVLHGPFRNKATLVESPEDCPELHELPADCKQFFKCARHLGKECKHLGGDHIPKERADIWDMPKASGQ